ncbi:hypothetical protein RJT34_32335 [Clitoria ternatea]|uniref:Uncharacterized protein n=1 Tax=Clitoria ternatea TaxID=43366 RepID=A0AAN9EXY1_CLITE
MMIWMLHKVHLEGHNKGTREDVSRTDQTEDDKDDDDFDDEAGYGMYHVQGTLREWVTRDEVRRFIARKFKDFLLTYVNPTNEHEDMEYVWLINEMVSANNCSSEIDSIPALPCGWLVHLGLF